MTQPKGPGEDPENEWHTNGDGEPSEYVAAPSAPPLRPGGRVRVDNRPEVAMGLDTQRIFEDVCTALACDPKIFQRANELVTVLNVVAEDREVADDAGTPRSKRLFAIGTPIIRPLSAPALGMRMSVDVKMMAFVAPSAKAIKRAEILGQAPKSELREVLPPPRIISSVLASGEWPDIRHLVGISETPFLRPDGTICQKPGYDEATGYIYSPAAFVPLVPAEPTQDEAKAAYAELADIFAEFPHVNGAARAVPIAAILTMLARPAIDGSIPCFVFDASTRGSGKTLQAHAVSLIALGKFAEPTTFPSEDDELEKILGSFAIAGASCILLDNITRPFGGAPLDKILTVRDRTSFRVLGRSEQKSLPWRAVVLASGNNIVFPEDTVRRVVVSRLESPLENPEDRDDCRDLPALCRERRGSLLRAGLTILRAYTSHGSPDAGLKRWGGFEAWARLIAHAIVFAGGPNVLDARPRGEAVAGDDLAALAVVLRELPRLSSDPIGCKAIIQALWPPGREVDAPPDGWEDLRDAVEVLAPPRVGRTPAPKALGEKFRRFASRVLGGLALTPTWAHGKQRVWTVRSAT